MDWITWTVFGVAIVIGFFVGSTGGALFCRRCRARDYDHNRRLVARGR